MTPNLSPQDFIRSASHAAHHFGFLPLDKIRAHPLCKECDSVIHHKATASDRRNDSLHGMLTSGMCSYFDYKLNALPGPVLFYTTEQTPRSGDMAVTLHVLNVKKSIAEALLIQTIRSLLNEVGYKKHVVRINSLGDTDSVTRYIRDLTHYLRKHFDEIPPAARENMKIHPLNALMYLAEKDHPVVQKSPNPLEYLTDASRKHFREIVEYLDMSNTPFEIDPRLLGHHECYSDALFAIDINDEDNSRLTESPLMIRGGRYSAFMNKMSKSKTPAVGAVLILNDKKAPPRIPATRVRYNPSVFLIQLGFGPKIRSLLLIDELRQAGVSVYQNIMSDSLGEQLQQAEEKMARYAIIVGHKEFMDGNVILRDLKEQHQQNISSGAIATHLRRLVLNR